MHCKVKQANAQDAGQCQEWFQGTEVVHQPRKFSLLGQDYVLWQDQQGTVTALPNACPHMGAMLSEG